MPATPEVLIVGAGPVGCTGALILARAGISVTLIDAAAELPIDLRASTFHPPTLDMLSTLGLTEHLITNGLIADRYQYRDITIGLAAEFDLTFLEGHVAHPYRVQCEQFKLTRHVASILQGMDTARIEMAARLAELVQVGEKVEATIERNGSSENRSYDYVIGCDGAGSVVRTALGTEFEGFTYPEQFLVIGTPTNIEEGLPDLAQVNYISSEGGWCVILRTVDTWRVLFPTDPGQRREFLTDPDRIEAQLQSVSLRAGRYEIAHKSLYRIQQRVAKNWRKGRILIAGDAAHLNNPLGGMGMNGGIHDIFNLTEKLIPVLKEGADPILLDQYERQRRAVTEEIIQKRTIQNKEKIEKRDEQSRVAWIGGLKDIAADKERAVAYLREANMINSLERAASIS